MTRVTTARRRRTSSPAFSSCSNLSVFLGTTKPDRSTPLHTSSERTSLIMVAAPPPNVKPFSHSRFLAPVPAPLPHELYPPRRGRNSRRRSREAEHFRKYIYLRKQLKPWSDDFRAKHGRTPNLIDVHASDIPGLLDRFVEYIDALQGVRFDTA